jgi:hypothetical protein
MNACAYCVSRITEGGGTAVMLRTEEYDLERRFPYQACCDGNHVDQLRCMAAVGAKPAAARLPRKLHDGFFGYAKVGIANPDRLRFNPQSRADLPTPLPAFLSALRLSGGPARRLSRKREKLTIGGQALLLAFAPFIAFAVLDRLFGSLEGLWAGAAVSMALLVRDWLLAGRQPKLLELGSFILFVALSTYTWLARPDWSVIAVRLVVDSGLLLIVIASLLFGRPFSMQYAREQVPMEYWGSKEFRKTNYVISGAWALAFFVMVLSETALLFLPAMPRRLGIIAIVIALIGAFKFTGWYPNRHEPTLKAKE